MAVAEPVVTGVTDRRHWLSPQVIALWTKLYPGAPAPDFTGGRMSERLCGATRESQIHGIGIVCVRAQRTRPRAPASRASRARQEAERVLGR